MQVVMNIVWGSLAGAGILLGAYVLVMGLYFWLCRKTPNSKFTEVWVVVATFAFSVVIKYILVFQTHVQVGGVPLAGVSVVDNIRFFFESLYLGIGGLAFEGFSDHVVLSTLHKALYTGSSILSGLVFVSVITAKSNYEFFSVIRLRFRVIVLRMLPFIKRNTYVFTALTEDTIKLAHSIDEEERNPVIIFSGSELGSFDKKDELCREVMTSGYYYYSLNKQTQKDGKKRSVAKRLKASNANLNHYDKRFVVFAFATEENGMPKEEENMDTVFEDIKARSACKDKLRIEYVILTKRTVNYSAYDTKTRALMLDYMLNDKKLSAEAEKIGIVSAKEYIMKSKDEQKEGAYGEAYAALKTAVETAYDKRVVIDVWNEAQALARHAAEHVVNETLLPALSARERSVITPKDDAPSPLDLRVWALGFGETSQAIVNDIYVQSAFVDMRGREARFVVDAFDAEMKNISGLFQATHPLYICQNIGEESLGLAENKTRNAWLDENFATFAALGFQDKAAVRECADAQISAYQKETRAAEKQKRKWGMYRQRLDAMWEKEIALDSIMQFPVVNMHEVSCLDHRFFKQIDQVTGVSGAARRVNKQVLADRIATLSAQDEALNKEREALVAAFCMPSAVPDVFVIATGDDFRNVQLANAFVQDIGNEVRTATENGTHNKAGVKRQVMLVHIRDERNNALLMSANGVWSEKRVLKLDGLTVIVVGNREETYTRSVVLEREQAAKYHFAYEEVAKAAHAAGTDLRYQDKSIRIHWQSETDSATESWVQYMQTAFAFFKENLRTSAKKSTLAEAFHRKTADAGAQSKEESAPQNKFKHIFSKENNGAWQNNIEYYWHKISLWDRESSRSANAYSAFLSAAYQAGTVAELQREVLFAWLAQLEHQRWMRRHIADGWVYQKENKNELLRRHSCLRPFGEAFNHATIIYDLLNVIWAMPDKTA